MANINWDKPFHVDPATLQPAASGVPIPTYGNYGGSGYSAGVFVLDPDPSHLDAGPVDALDQQFLLHDQATAAARTPAEQAAADLGLLQGVVALDAGQLDAGASLYGGLTTLVMIERLAVNSGLGLLSPEELARATRDALGDIGRGLAGLDADEAEQARDWLRDVSAATGHDLGGVLEAVVGFGPGDLHVARGEWLISQAGDWLRDVSAATGHDLGGVLDIVGFGPGDLHAARGEWLISQAGEWLRDVTTATGHDIGGVLEAVGFGLGDLHAARGEWLIS